jgi:hypothetical protein
MASNTKLNELTSNQYYGGLNRRFANRLDTIRRMHFRWNRETNEWYREEHRKDKHCIAATFVMNADKRAWLDELERWRFGR